MKSPVKYIVLCALVSTGLAAEQGPGDSDRPSHIVGGESATADEFPFVAKIIYQGNQVGCTGSLIAPNRVLTAGHCVANWKERFLTVAFGASRWGGTSFEVTRRILHPEYSNQEDDIAILEFEPAASIQPVRVLTLEEEQQYSPSGGQGMAVGWGRMVPGDPDSLPTRLQKVSVPIYTEMDCKRILGDLRDQGKKPQPPGIYESILCAGQENRATGHGDSGGPLLVQTPDGWAQVGVLSQATQNPDQTVVYMGQYTRTSFVYDWIYSSDAEDPPKTVDAYQLHFAHFGTGGGMETDLLLLNPQEEETEETTVEVFAPDGTPLFPSDQVTVPEMGMLERTLPAGEELETGSVVVTASTKLAGFLRFRYSDGGATAISATPLSSGFIIPLSSHSDRTGLAIRNADTESVTVLLRLGSLPDVYRTIPAQGQIAAFIDEYFPGQEQQALLGTLLVQTEPPGGKITVLGLEFIGDSLVTLAAAPVNEDALRDSAVPDPGNNSGLVSDYRVLLGLRSQLAGTANLDWDSELDIAEWDGIDISGSPPRVLSLDLSDSQLTGEIPEQLSQLTHLESLDLSSNQLAGEIPAELGQLTQLESLDVSYNQLTGEIPAELGQLTQLESLNLYINQLTGEIPAELAQLVRLQRLFLGYNQLTGEIPSELAQLTQLRLLHVYNNELTGEIPVWLGSLPQLERLYLGINQLTGEIPAELGQLSQLTSLYLDANKLTGEIPVWLEGLSQLQALHLNNNQLTGGIPVGLEGLSRLSRLHLNTNELTGEIPAELGRLSQLRSFHLQHNQLTGMIPNELDQLSNLRQFSFRGNEFTGSAPPGLSGLPDIYVLNLIGRRLGTGQLKLTWDDPLDSTASYEYRLRDATGAWTDWAAINWTESNTLEDPGTPGEGNGITIEWTLRGLPPGVLYTTASVRASNKSSVSPEASVVLVGPRP